MLLNSNIVSRKLFIFHLANYITDMWNGRNVNDSSSLMQYMCSYNTIQSCTIKTTVLKGKNGVRGTTLRNSIYDT